MKDEEKDIELIEAYLKGQLTGSALQDFELRRTSDPSFASDVDDYLLIMKEVDAAGQISFINKVKGWEDEIASKEKKTKVIPLRRLLAVAATLLLIATAGGYIFFKSLPAGNADLFDQYFEPYEDVISQRSADVGPFQKGMNFYNEGKYAEAIKHLEVALEEDQADLSIRCYLGICYLATNQTLKGKDIFESLANSDPGLYREIAEWNLALAYLNLDEIPDLERQLNVILQQKDHMYFKQATDLSAEL
ncbi:MAG TPA: tetratricopeptide repeat protein [Chryseolinea sp.]